MGVKEILEEINKVVENLNYKNSINFIEELERLEEGGDKMSKKYTGRPRKYETPEQMQEIINEYFNECLEEGKYPTVSMLAYRLDLTRQDLLRYEGEIEAERFKNCSDEMRESFRYTIKKAKQYIEGQYEDRLINDGRSPIGTIFTLKNNYNWVDKQEIEQTNKTIEVTLED